MNCLKCKGACCETIVIPDFTSQTDPETARDANYWLRLHGGEHPSGTELECACWALLADGRCSIYDWRPQVCRDFEAGSRDCLVALKRMRGPVDYNSGIREDGDPPWDELVRTVEAAEQGD